MAGVRHSSDMGRALPEGRGVVPDLPVRREGYTARERAFLDSLGSSYPAFRTAVSEVALNARGDGNIVSEDFEVTPEMRARVYGALVERGVRISPELFAAAARYVDRQLGQEIARELFGEAAATRRRLLSDRQTQAALELINRAASQPELVSLAAETAR
jgi:hypothetical protein